MHTYKKFGYVAGIVLSFLLCVCLHTPVVHAAQSGLPIPGAGIDPGSVTTSLQSGIANMVSWIIIALNGLMWIIFIILSYLLDPYFIFDLEESGQGGSFVQMLNEVWQLSRDLMNVIFAFVLVGTAIYTIVTAKQEFVKAHIAKFVMAVILVNFSWFVPRVIMDIANVTAATIYSIPSLMAQQNSAAECYVLEARQTSDQCTEDPNTTPKYKCPCLRVTNADLFVDDKFINKLKQSGTLQETLNPANPPSLPYWYCFADVYCVQFNKLEMTTVSGQSAILNGLIINHAHLADLAMVPPQQQINDKPAAMISFILQEVMVLFIHIALFFPMLALVFAFFIRIPILWLTIAFMPFIFVSFVIDQQFITEYPNKLRDMFLKAAFLPAMVAIPFAIGFIMINAGSQVTTTVTDLKIPLITDIDNFWQLLWLGMSIGVIWVGVFAVLQKMGGIFEKGSLAIKEVGETLGRVAIKAPLSVPFLPGPGGNLLSPLQYKNLPRQIEYGLDSGRGLGGAFNDLRTGHGLGAMANRQAAQEMDAQGLERLHEDLIKLREAISSGDKDKEAEAIKKIKNDHGVEINPAAPHESMNAFLDELRRLQHDRGPDFEKPYRNLEDETKKLRQETEKRAASSPPAGK